MFRLFDEFATVLRNLKDDKNQLSVNNLNGYIEDLEKRVESIIKLGRRKETESSCAWIIKHASRTKIKQKAESFATWAKLFSDCLRLV